MFIIVEGTDASGKSSLISEINRQVSELYPNQQISYFHKGRPDEETRRWVLEEYAIDVSLIDWRASIAIADRWHWGEVTYAPLKRAHTCTDDFGLLGVSGWRWVELFLMSRGASQFWLHQPLEVIQKRLSLRGDTFVSPDELAYILERYTFCANNAVASLAGELTPREDSSQLIGALAKHVITVASARAQGAARLANYPEYIGRFGRALIWFIGALVIGVILDQQGSLTPGSLIVLVVLGIAAAVDCLVMLRFFGKGATGGDDRR